MAQHLKRPPRPEPACEAACRSGNGEQVGQGACSVALVDGALVGTIMFKPVDRTGGYPGLNRPNETSLGQLAVAPERQALKLGRPSGPDGGTSGRDGEIAIAASS